MLFLLRLGSFGFWDPTEVRVADAARALMEGHAPAGTPVAFNTGLTSLGFASQGISELGGRLPFAVCSLLALVAVYYAGRAIMRPRAALLSAIAFATMPSVLFGGRQLTSAAPLTLAVTLALGGLAHCLWPRAGSNPVARVLGALVAAAGLGLGHAAGGLLPGVLAPLLAVTVALWASGAGRARALVLTLVAVGLAVAAGLDFRKHGVVSRLLGGIPRMPQFQTVVTSVVRSIGFSTAPWLAVTPFAVLRSLDGSYTADEDDAGRRAFARVLLPAWLATTYLMATLHAAVVTEAIVPAAPVLALLAGLYLDELLGAGQRSSAQRAIEGIAVGVMAIILGHDVLLTGEAFISVQSIEQLRWPVQLNGSVVVVFAFMALFGALVAAALLLPPNWPFSDGGKRRPVQRGLVLGALGVQVAFAFTLVQWFIPTASKHLSPKDLYGKTRKLDPNAPLGQYRFNATGSTYYMGGHTAAPLNTLDDLLTFLKRPERVFVFVGAEELASIDQTARQGAKHAAGENGPDPISTMTQYYVIDDSNSRFLILSNKLGANETDLNPLRRFVSEAPTAPQTKLSINFEDKLELIGFDIPTAVNRGEDVKVRLHFKVLAPVGASYKVFLHFDGPGARVNGDHVPLDGKFPTQFWSAGTYVIDEYLLKPDRATQPAGAFQLYFGLFAGDRRMKVKVGASDGENRIKLGAIRVH